MLVSISAINGGSDRNFKVSWSAESNCWKINEELKPILSLNIGENYAFNITTTSAYSSSFILCDLINHEEDNETSASETGWKKVLTTICEPSTTTLPCLIEFEPTVDHFPLIYYGSNSNNSEEMSSGNQISIVLCSDFRNQKKCELENNSTRCGWGIISESICSLCSEVEIQKDCEISNNCQWCQENSHCNSIIDRCRNENTESMSGWIWVLIVIGVIVLISAALVGGLLGMRRFQMRNYRRKMMLDDNNEEPITERSISLANMDRSTQGPAIREQVITI